VREIAWKAQTRLCQRYRQMLGKGKLKQGVVTAIARELAGFVWAIACITSDPPQPDLGENGCAEMQRVAPGQTEWTNGSRRIGGENMMQ
jgi:hypothetical protein